MSAILDLPETRARAHRWTVAEYEKLGDDPVFRRLELIRGIIVEKMSITSLHSGITTRIYRFFTRVLPEEYIARQEQPLRLWDSMPEPDISVVRGTVEECEKQHPVTARLALEVAVTSVSADREKASIYAEAGVGEYWIVLAEHRSVEVYRCPEAGMYHDVRTYRPGELIPEIEGLGLVVPVDAFFSA